MITHQVFHLFSKTEIKILMFSSKTEKKAIIYDILKTALEYYFLQSKKEYY